MRKITEEAVECFLNAVEYRKGNTVIEYTEKGTAMVLHGRVIAYKEGSAILLMDAGWQTNTTKERLNGILRMTNHGGIYQRKGEWFINGEPWTGTYAYRWNKWNDRTDV